MGAAILVFGAAVRPDGSPSPTLRARVAAAANFGAGLAEPLYVPTGGQGRHGPPESTVMAALLRAHGVPAGHIAEEPTGTDTLSSVRACVRLLRVQGHTGPVYAASSGYHLPRCLLLLRLAGLQARPVPPPQAGDRRWYWRLREVPAMPYDAALLLWGRLTGRG